MKKLTTQSIRLFWLSSFALLILTNSIFAAPVVWSAAGANPAAIQTTVDAFRADLGTLNPNNGQSFTSGRRQIDWDAVPDQFSSPNNLPANFFNVNSRRGAVFTTACGNAEFRVSSNAASGVPVRFGEIDPSYTSTFTTFSAQKVFTVISDNFVPCNILTVNFFIPGTEIPATVRGFGVVFTDVDISGDTRLLAYDAAGKLLEPGGISALQADGGLSFVGVSFDQGERIATVQIVSGNNRLTSGNVDGANGLDIIAMDDFIYGEPRATEAHPVDFDGDGTSDISVYRPSTGQWFILNSGTGTFTTFTWGQNGDIPIDGDFDGDKRSDVTVFRPTTGEWFRLNSSDGAFVTTTWGIIGDKPVAADYDKDGKADIAVRRPSDGNYFILRSSNGALQQTTWGVNGDIPLTGAVQQ